MVGFLHQPFRQLHKRGIVCQPVILAARFEGKQGSDFVLVHVVIQFDEQPAGQLVELHGLVHVVPAPGDVSPFVVDVSQLHLVGEQVEGVEGQCDKIKIGQQRRPNYNRQLIVYLSYETIAFASGFSPYRHQRGNSRGLKIRLQTECASSALT